MYTIGFGQLAVGEVKLLFLLPKVERNVFGLGFGGFLALKIGVFAKKSYLWTMVTAIRPSNQTTDF